MSSRAWLAMHSQELSHMNDRLVRLLAGSALLLCASYSMADTPIDTPRFNIARYEVSGDTLLGKQLVQALVAPFAGQQRDCLLYTSPSPRDRTRSRMPSSA